jgi:hypothetical protein
VRFLRDTGAQATGQNDGLHSNLII